MTVIGVTGDSGSGKSYLTNYLANQLDNTAILECDIYHLWERADPHWQQFTHLNSDCNNLIGMQQDIIALRDGRSIWRRAYDHTNGKFTELREIKSSKHLIVCGLHTLYYPELYDFKIYLDPSIELKLSWKISRDIVKRGYSREQVIEQIKRREPDFEKYILPQKERADLIVNFRTKKDIRIGDMRFNSDVECYDYLVRRICEIKN